MGRHTAPRTRSPLRAALGYGLTAGALLLAAGGAASIEDANHIAGTAHAEAPREGTSGVQAVVSAAQVDNWYTRQLSTGSGDSACYWDVQAGAWISDTTTDGLCHTSTTIYGEGGQAVCGTDGQCARWDAEHPQPSEGEQDVLPGGVATYVWDDQQDEYGWRFCPTGWGDIRCGA